ncbi:hypothetical protein glysoja_047971 [Glycine soja]|uniref:Uncharacterized protein n=1 Tax=Glycine soja TaxID=3848 RepID=A0A0B2RSN9_GLYSO|nr:hypothetical protein glysoja_047971 [Glycine soja]
MSMLDENEVVGDDMVEIPHTKKDIWSQNVESHFITLMEEEVKKDDEWKKLCEFKKKSCLHYDELSIIFGDTAAFGANQHPSTKSPSTNDDDDGVEHSSQPKKKALEDCHVNIIRSLVNDSDEEIENVMQLYIMFEYTNLLNPKPQPQRTSILKGHE